MEKGEAEEPHPHVVILPIPAQGHVKPMLKLAELLSHSSFRVTFINTEYVHTTFLSSVDIHSFSRRFPKFRFVSIPDGLPPDSPRSGKGIIDVLLSLRDTAKASLLEVLVSLRQPPTCIIADGIVCCAAIDAGEEFGVPVWAFRTYSACCTWTFICPSSFKKGKFHSRLVSFLSGYFSRKLIFIFLSDKKEIVNFSRVDR
ncbi:hypothetical protein GQ457_17G007010 [Hibiscus cannabinus]